ncbi:DNA modification methylase [Pseudomonas sp. SJZ085]|uniref:DNA-methyltransferase n=1 Tax=unclassified Pseudomonas TaxID=196821 RepID=UPI00119B33C8|nr:MULTISPECIES: site-specific DNA-methyltransferase [unclassified Pseudomonas]TWC11415.1 DNA modification methylase [Pseudomonas sp. SJZ074]TWC30017.1 DNA modification methylase [Pseudomonas sp. SJZ085]
MTPSHQILVGDCIDMMRTLPDRSVQCCVTSPPYYGLRDYGVDGQIGLEETPADFIARVVEVVRGVRRVLRDDGTAWVNMGDSYASGGRGGGGSFMAERGDGAWQGKGQATGWRSAPAGLKHKDLMGMPWRLAFALQDDGWYLRQDIIWHKPNPMPESTRDRCTKAHEYLFLLSKSPRYYYDQASIREPAIGGQTEAAMQFGRNGPSGEHVIPGQRFAQHRPGRPAPTPVTDTRNKRRVWTVATAGYQGAHFATFPPDLIRPCILAGAPRGGVVLDPFGGAGTTAVVAMQEGRRSILSELNPEYAAMAERRIAAAWLDGAAQMDVFHDAAPAT